MLIAALDEPSAIAATRDSGASGAVTRPIDPRLLPTLTTTGLADFASTGRNACVVRTRPNTLVSYSERISSAVTSPVGTHGWSITPALLTSTSSAPTVSTAASTDESSVMSSWTNNAP